MPDPDFTVRDVKLLVGKLLFACVAEMLQLGVGGPGSKAGTTCPFGYLTASGKKVLMGGGRSRCELQPSHSGEQVGLQSRKKLY